MNEISVKEFLNKMKNLVNYSNNFTINYIDKNDEEILDLNKQQIFDGKQKTNKEINGEYSEFTERMNAGESFNFNGKSKTKKAGDTYFLLDSKEFFNSFKEKTNKDNFNIVADTLKKNKKGYTNLLSYGKDILGLSNENILNLQIDISKELTIDLQQNYFK